MSMILDLSAFKEESLDVTMPDGKVLHIVKPTQAMVIKVLQLRNIDNNSEPERIIASFNSLVKNILNSNNAGIAFEDKYVEEMPMNMKTAIINSYSEFITGLQSNPN